MPLKILNVAGARPNFMKIAPLIDAMKGVDAIQGRLVHTGQHYDESMSGSFFEDLQMPTPDFYLGVGSGTHAQQTAKTMVEFEKVLDAERPDLVIVVGDVNSTLACSLVAAKCLVPIAHVEAGLRSFDRTMPEEVNRKVTDHVSDILFTTSEDANVNLKAEGIAAERVHFVGNVMIDSLRKYEAKARQKQSCRGYGLGPQEYALLTLHRPSNVDDPAVFSSILRALETVARGMPILFPIHPRSRKRLAEQGLGPDELRNIVMCDPCGYLAFQSLVMDSRFVLTDSGGIQEETTALGIPCLTLRPNTERPITVSLGTNVVVGVDPSRIIEESMKILAGHRKPGSVPPLWDGKAASRIVERLCQIHFRAGGS